MKKITLILIVCMVFSTLLCFNSNAESMRIFENDPITVPFSEPTIDGVIGDNEGWSKVAYLNEDTASHCYNQMQLTSTTDLYFAYSDEGLYFAASYNEGHAAYSIRLYDEEGNWVNTHDYIDANAESYDFEHYPEYAPDGTKIEASIIPPAYDTITVPDAKNAFWYANGGNNAVYSDGPDDLDDAYGWNGDVISLTFDMLGLIDKAGTFENEDTDNSIQYNVGIFEGDIVKIATSRTNNDDITDICQGKGKLTDDNITFEVFIPWDRIVSDMTDTCKIFGVDHTFTKEEIIASGATHRASVTLMDRMFDPEAGYVDSWGRFITVCSVCSSGNEGYKVGSSISGMGLKLIMGEKAGDETTAADSSSDTANGGGAVITKSAGTDANNTKKSTTDKSSGSASTFDSAIVIPFVLCGIAIVGIAVITKKKQK